jgi:hypothetical protein
VGQIMDFPQPDGALAQRTAILAKKWEFDGEEPEVRTSKQGNR